MASRASESTDLQQAGSLSKAPRSGFKAAPTESPNSGRGGSQLLPIKLPIPLRDPGVFLLTLGS